LRRSMPSRSSSVPSSVFWVRCAWRACSSFSFASSVSICDSMMSLREKIRLSFFWKRPALSRSSRARSAVRPSLESSALPSIFCLRILKPALF